MKSFSSSAINKSGKKFAPKAPVRRGPPASAAPARRPSAVQQAQAQTAQASQQERNVTSSVPPPSASPAEPAQPPVPQDVPVAAPASDSQETASPTTTEQAITPIPVPISQPQRKPSIPTPTPNPQEPTTVTPPVAAPDVQPSPHTLSAEPQIVPSIEHHAEQNPQPWDPVLHLLAELQPQEPEPRDQHAAATPIGRPIRFAQKTSEIGKSSKPGPRQPATFTPPTSQIVVSTIESETPARSVGPTSAAPSTPEPSQANGKGKKRKVSKAGTEADGTEKPKRRRRKREATPDGAETVEILPNVVKMSELCKDLKTGKKSKRETELRRLEAAEEERKHKAQEEGSTTGTPAKKASEPSSTQEAPPTDPKPQNGPVMRIVNGEIVLDAASLEVDRHADAARTAGDLEDVVENQLTRKINQATYGKRTKTESWDEDMTDLFYRGLRMFGTDFMVISKLFPGRSRRQIKLKFNNEERRDPQRIKDTLWGPREIIDIATYSEMTNTVYDDPKVIQQELDYEKKLIEEQHAKEKQLQEEMMRNPTGDGGADAKNPGDKANGASKGKGRKDKKQSKGAGGGTEEVLGSIDDFPTAV